MVSIAETLDCCDLFVGDRPQRHVAGGHRAIADHDIAGAAFVGAAAEMSTSQAKPAAQQLEQRLIGVCVDGCFDAIQVESNGLHGALDDSEFAELWLNLFTRSRMILDILLGDRAATSCQ